MIKLIKILGALSLAHFATSKTNKKTPIKRFLKDKKWPHMSCHRNMSNIVDIYVDGCKVGTVDIDSATSI
jgi:hypothetical protein